MVPFICHMVNYSQPCDKFTEEDMAQGYTLIFLIGNNYKMQFDSEYRFIHAFILNFLIFKAVP